MKLIIDNETFDPVIEQCISLNVEKYVPNNYMCMWCNCIDYNNHRYCRRCHNLDESDRVYSLCLHWRLDEGYI